MQKIVIPVRLNSARSMNVEIPMGARPRGIIPSVEQVSGILASAGKQAVREVINIIMECDAESEDGQILPPIIDHKNYMIVATGQPVDEASLTYIGSAPSIQTGNLLHVFEFTPHPST